LREVEGVGVIVANSVACVEHAVLIPRNQLRERRRGAALGALHQLSIAQLVLVRGSIHSDLAT
jgi:hypothetical protein